MHGSTTALLSWAVLFFRLGCSDSMAAVSPQKLPRHPCQRCAVPPEAPSLSPKGHGSCRAVVPGRRELSRLRAAAKVSSVIVHLPGFALPRLFGDARLHHARKERTTPQNKKRLQVKQLETRWGCWGSWTLVPAQGKQVQHLPHSTRDRSRTWIQTTERQDRDHHLPLWAHDKP